MGFFSKLFGGTDDSSQKAQIAQNRESLAYTKEQAGIARGDANRLFEQASGNRRAGYEAALEMLGGTIPQQFDVYQQGRQNQQNTMLAGQDQIINALMGNAVDTSGMRAAPLNIDPSVFNVSLPERVQQEQQQAQPFDLAQYLAGIYQRTGGV